MNIGITIDDNGNPIFSQEGVMDLDSIIRDVLIDQDALKDVFTDKFKNLAENIKIDSEKLTKEISTGITDIFTFSGEFKKDIRTVFKNKVNKVVDDITVDKKLIQESINNLFTYADKDKHLKNLFERFQDLGVPDADLTSAMTKRAEMDIVGYTYQEERSFDAMGNSSPVGVDATVMKVFSEDLSDAISEKNYTKLSTLFDPTTTISKVAEDSVFDSSEATPVHIMGVDPDVVSLFGATSRKGKDEINKSKPKGGNKFLDFVADSVSGALGLSAGVAGASAGVAGLKSAFMGKLGGIGGIAKDAGKFATNPVTLLVAGLTMAVADGIKGATLADEWGVKKSSGVVGAVMGGAGSGIMNALKNAGKWAALGASAGSFGGPIGMIIGGVAGGVIGGVLGFFGGEKIAKATDAVGNWAGEKWDKVTEETKKIFGKSVDLFKLFGTKLKSGIAKVTPTFIKDLIGMDEDGNISFGQSQIAKDYQARGFVGGSAMLLGRMSDVIRRGLAKVTPQFIKDLIGMDEYGVIDLDKSEAINTIQEKGWKGGSKELLSKAAEKMRAGIASIIPQFIKDLIGMDEYGVIDLDKSEAINTIQEKGWKGGILELLKIVKENLIKGLVNVLPRPVKALIGLSDDGTFDLAGSGIGKKASELKSNVEEKIEATKERTAEALDNAGNWISDKWGAVKEKYEDLAYGESGSMSESIKGSGKLLTGEARTEDVNDLAITQNSVQFQLHDSDKLETFGNEQLYTKNGGTLDNAIGDVADKLQTQLNEMTNFKNMFMDYMKHISQYNSQMLELIPTLASAPPQNNSENFAMPDGYVRDPIYEFRMNTREILG